MEKIFRKLSVVFLLLLLLINNGVVNNIQAETGGEEITLNEDENSTSVYVSNDDNKESETSNEKIESTTIELAADDSLETTTFVQDENGNLQQEEPQEETQEITEVVQEEIIEETVAFDESKQIDNVLISVTANEGVFPDDAILYAEIVEIKEVEDAISENRDENKNVAISYTYDIKVLDAEGNELTPNGEVSVKFSLVEKIQEAVSVDVYHIDDELNVETLETTVSENTEIEEINTDVEVTTDSFSYYTVEFTYNNLTISIDGDSTNELLPILNNVGINGEIQNVEVSNSDLFEGYKENDVWYVDAKQAFTSDEWMKVTIDGVEYEVEVTDAVNTTFYIEAIEATTITLSKVGSPSAGTAKYGINNTSPSTAYTYGNSISLSAGQKCYWTITSTTTAFSSSNYLKFTSTGKINAGGNLSSLIGGNTSIPRNYCFFSLFRGCTNLIDASAINFGSITSFNSATYAFSYMFYGCTSLTTAPALPATTLANYCYQYMFYNCKLTTAPALPATTLANSCYGYMFRNCKSLTTAPQLPATTLTSNCYSAMFYNCTSLTTAPELPATTLALGCYSSMFYGCKSLTTAPDLPVTTLVDACYQDMFFGCTSLTTAPALPATTLTTNCYYEMFYNCTSLTTAPALPATTLNTNCYYEMFYNCTSLTTAPELPATTLANVCYKKMFYGCTSLKLSETKTDEYRRPYIIPSEGTGTTASDALTDMFTGTGGTFTGTPTINTTYYLWDPTYVELFNSSYFYIEAVENTTITLSKVGSPTVGNAKYSIDLGTPVDYNYGDSINLTAGQKCYWYIESTNTDFTNESTIIFTSTGKINAGGNLSSLIGNETIIPRDYCFTRLFYYCDKLIDASLINFGSITDFNSKENVFAYMFYGCTSLTTAPALPATTLAVSCYESMFDGCTSLTTAPALPATTLADSCYTGMFQSCTSLTVAPELPATTLAYFCYAYMFCACASLTTPPVLPATILADYCYYGMFGDCTSLTTLPELPATTLAANCYQSMFGYCANIKISEVQTGQYQIPYRIPTSGTGTAGTDSLADMFANTGGTFAGTPEINTTYYLWDPSYTSYTLSIPAAVDASAGSIVISYEAIGTDVDVSITSANNWKLKNNTSSLDYSLSETAFTLIEGTGIQDVNISVSGTPTLAGKHSDIVTFTYSEAFTPLPLTDNYVGYYADVDADGTADGVIFFDYAHGADTTEGFLYAGVEVAAKTTGLASYTLINENTVQKVGGGDDRFYVIALDDVKPASDNNTAYWYYSASSDGISDYATLTSTAFGSGKTNTATMKAKWDTEAYGTQNTRDIWSIDMGDWFVMSKDEWSVLGSNLKKVASSSTYSSITTDAGASLVFLYYYYSSSSYTSSRAWTASFMSTSMSSCSFDTNRYVRLATTF